MNGKAGDRTFSVTCRRMIAKHPLCPPEFLPWRKFPVRLAVVYADMGSFDCVAASLRHSAEDDSLVEKGEIEQPR